MQAFIDQQRAIYESNKGDYYDPQSYYDSPVRDNTFLKFDEQGNPISASDLTVGHLSGEIEIENLKHDYKIKSITYRFNTIEYYKDNPYYCQATVELYQEVDIYGSSIYSLGSNSCPCNCYYM